MKLRTSLQLSAVFPIVFAIVMAVTLRWWFRAESRSEYLDMVFLALTGVFGLAMSAVIIRYTRDILKKIRMLNEWTDAVLKGDLEASIDIAPSDDEVGRLILALSSMMQEIRTAYASLYKEANNSKHESVEQKRLADAAQLGTRQLAAGMARYKEAQQEIMRKERLHVLEQVIRGVVHDFGESLTPIQGTLDVLTSQPERLADRAQVLKHLETMSYAVQNARRSLKNLTGIYHVYQERLGPADLNQLVKRTVDLLEPRWKAEAQLLGKSIEVRTGLQPIPTVAGDEADLQDAIMHLVSNSLEAMPDGGTITLSTYSKVSGVALEVRDTGKGMSPDVLIRCREPFYTTKGPAGTGMGLTIADSVIRRCHGTLEVESEVGKGTRIVIMLPVWSEAQESREKKPVTPTTRKLSILVVDDEGLSRKVTALILSAQGHTVASAASGAEGLEKLKELHADVVILDRAMPGMDGAALALAVKKASPETAVIMLTGYADIMREQGNVPAAVDVVLAKPASQADIENALAAALDARKPAGTTP